MEEITVPLRRFQASWGDRLADRHSQHDVVSEAFHLISLLRFLKE